MSKATFSERLKLIIQEKNIRQVDLCRKTGIGKSAMSQYLHGSFEPKQQKLYALAAALDVSEAWLMGYDVPRQRVNSINSDKSAASAGIDKTMPICSEPVSGSFYFQVPDDSMEELHIPKGAIALVEKRSAFSSGQIVHFSLEDQPPALRTFHQDGDSIFLLAADPCCVPILCKDTDLTTGVLKISGVVTQVMIRL